jgi:hypothetical protein
MLKMRGFPVSAKGVAACYRDLIDVLIADLQDESARPAIAEEKVHPVFTNTVMNSDAAKVALAKFALSTVAREAAR